MILILELNNNNSVVSKNYKIMLSFHKLQAANQLTKETCQYLNSQ